MANWTKMNRYVVEHAATIEDALDGITFEADVAGWSRRDAGSKFLALWPSEMVLAIRLVHQGTDPWA